MTAQIGDTYKYKNKDYSIVAMSSPLIFNPNDYGLTPAGVTTACWKGYWCEYSIEENSALLLKNLFIHEKDDIYPPINGVAVSPLEYIKEKAYTSKGIEIITSDKYFGHRVYEEVNLPISYNGRILAGNDFIQDYYIHMGYQRSWAYRTLLEFVFDEGILIECNDYSETAQKQREMIDATEPDPAHPDHGNIPQFVADSFSLDYDEKAWWIKDKDKMS